ncbi:hypothetical protein BASA81_001306 [Batrachochytrium salamandrivorans]|nr:hypothetical protein BASA81_001306 [Batrachochytrium salamandrivorans]
MPTVLCLHGRRQCGLTFANKLFPNAPTSTSASGLVTVSLPQLDFVFPNAPFTSQANLPKGFKPKSTSGKCSSPSLFSWWGETNEDDGSTALNSLAKLLQDTQPVGVVGFSQGGALAASLCRKQSSLDFAVFLSSYYVLTPQEEKSGVFTPPALIRFQPQDEFPPRIRSLHCFSDTDQVVGMQFLGLD